MTPLISKSPPPIKEKTHFPFRFTATNWILGELGETCKIVCEKRNRICNSDEQSKITCEYSIKKAMLKAGQTCIEVDGPRHYPGTPFFSNDTTCVYLTTGQRSVCDGNKWAHHKALCYCDGKVLYSYVNSKNSKSINQL